MGKVISEQKAPAEAAQPSRMVKCDVCGRNYNQRYLTSHKRLAHGSKKNSAPADEAATIETILSLYKRISTKAKADLLRRLAAESNHA